MHNISDTIVVFMRADASSEKEACYDIHNLSSVGKFNQHSHFWLSMLYIALQDQH